MGNKCMSNISQFSPLIALYVETPGRPCITTPVVINLLYTQFLDIENKQFVISSLLLFFPE